MRGCARCKIVYADFWQVTGDALDFALESLNLTRPALRERLMQLYLGLEPFAEVPSVLGSLRETGLRTAILSNGSPKMLEALVGSMRSLRSARSRASVRSSSAPASRLQPTTSAARIAAIFRVSAIPRSTRLNAA